MYKDPRDIESLPHPGRSLVTRVWCNVEKSFNILLIPHINSLKEKTHIIWNAERQLKQFCTSQTNSLWACGLSYSLTTWSVFSWEISVRSLWYYPRAIPYLKLWAPRASEFIRHTLHKSRSRVWNSAADCSKTTFLQQHIHINDKKDK